MNSLNAWPMSLGGGCLIGVAVSLMLLWNGRVTGISGILFGTLTPQKGDIAWRWAFLLGLLGGGFTLNLLWPETLIQEGAILGIKAGARLLLAGFLVGFGTVLGSGCTSGHGVCGISRLSPRSLLATMIFIASGVATVAALRALGWLS